MSKRIPVADLKAGHLYRVEARNFEIAVFDGNRAYTGIRHKFGNVYLGIEFDYEIEGAPYGTCTPVEDLGPFPVSLDDKDALFDALVEVE